MLSSRVEPPNDSSELLKQALGGGAGQVAGPNPYPVNPRIFGSAQGSPVMGLDGFMSIMGSQSPMSDEEVAALLKRYAQYLTQSAGNAGGAM